MKEEDLKDLEKKLWESADKMRGAVPVSSYKFIILGLIFLKYISDSFEEKYQALIDEGYGLEEDRDAYLMDNVFYVPSKARWEYLNVHSKDSNIGQVIDEALEEIEKENPSLKGVLIKNYNSPDYRNVNLGELIDLFTNIKIGSKEAQDKDILGRIYEYFLGQFASNELQKGGEFYTPACLVRTMVEILEPYKGRIYDPACGSGGMFVQSVKFIEKHKGTMQNVAIFGQEKNPTTWKLAKMNLAIRQIEGNLGDRNADTFHNDLHKSLKANFILANPPFNISDWGGDKLRDDVRWKYGIPPAGNANYAWLQHMIHHLNPENGVAGTVLANGALASDSSGEGEIRKNMIEGRVVECIVAMPSQLFYATGIPCSLWIMRRNRDEKTRNKVLFIDARNLGSMIDRKVRELTEEDISKIATTYHNWRNDTNYEDELGFCKSATIDEVKQNDYALTPGRYVGTPEDEDDGIPFEEKMKKLTSELSEQLKEEEALNIELKKVLGAIGYEI